MTRELSRMRHTRTRLQGLADRRREISLASAARGAGSSAPRRRRGVDRRPQRCRHRKCSGGYALCRHGRRHGAGNDRRLDLRVYRNMPNICPFLSMIVSGVGRLWATRQGSWVRRQDALHCRSREADTRGRWQHQWALILRLRRVLPNGLFCVPSSGNACG